MSAQAASSTGVPVTSGWRGLLPGSYAGAGTPTLQFTPTRPLLPGEPVQVAVTTRATSQAGVAPGAAATYQFRAAATGGTGQFPDEDIAVGNSPAAIVTGDLNHDGNPDLVVNDVSSDLVRVLIGNGTGGFLPFPAPGSNQVGVGGVPGPERLALGDANHDGSLDLFAVGNRAFGQYGVTLGDGTGRFANPVPAAYASEAVSGLAVGGVNGDGNDDLLTGLGRSAKVIVRLSNAQGGFTAGTDVPVGSVTSLALADVNGDGQLDLLALNATSTSSTVSVRLGDGHARFVAPATPEVAVTTGALELAVGDVNRDGKPDFLTSSRSANAVSVRLGNGAGAFQAVADVSVGASPSRLALADFNRDGNLDFVTTLNGANSTTASVRVGDGRGGFGNAPQPEVPLGLVPWGLALADVNKDGQADLLVGNTGYPNGSVPAGDFGTVSVRLGDGAGRFVRVPVPRVPVAGTLAKAVVADVNQDGRPDLLGLYSLNGVGGVSVRLGNGAGGFAPPAAPTPAEVANVGTYPSALAVGDVNNDGALDFVTNASAGAFRTRPLTWATARGALPRPPRPDPSFSKVPSPPWCWPT